MQIFLVAPSWKGPLKFVHMLTGGEDESRRKVHEYWEILPQFSSIRHSMRAGMYVTEPEAPFNHMPAFKDLVLDESDVESIRQAWPKAKRKQIEEAWSIAGILREFGKSEHDGLRKLVHMAHAYGMSSHLLHKDADGVGMVWERSRRTSDRQVAVTLGHSARVVSDMCQFAKWRLLFLLKVCGEDTNRISIIEDEYSVLFEELQKADSHFIGPSIKKLRETPSMSDLYRMTVDLNVLDHLGINLYSNIAAVLTEAVANAWDADAETVDIKIDPDAKWIEIVDDGVGMTIGDMNDKYLRVGYRRREEDTEHGKYTAKGRQVMGRKGLGKLSLFSIAKLIDVQSAKDGQSHGLRMSVDGIHKSVENKEPFYRPDPLPEDEVTVTKGTKIVLRDIKRQRLGRGATALRKTTGAAFFRHRRNVHNFKITIDGQPVTTADRGDLPIVQFLWRFGDFQPDPSSIPEVLEQEQLPQPVRWLG